MTIYKINTSLYPIIFAFIGGILDIADYKASHAIYVLAIILAIYFVPGVRVVK